MSPPSLDTLPQKKIREKDEQGEHQVGKKRSGPTITDGGAQSNAARRREQIRVAQRAHRLRKETTILNLRKRVEMLEGVTEEMSKAFLEFSDTTVKSGLLQINPEFGQEVKRTTQVFVDLATVASHEESEILDKTTDRSHESSSLAEKVRVQTHHSGSQDGPLILQPSYQQSEYQQQASRWADKFSQHSSKPLVTDLLQPQMQSIQGQGSRPLTRPLEAVRHWLPKGSFARQLHRLTLEEGYWLLSDRKHMENQEVYRIFQYTLSSYSVETVFANMKESLEMMSTKQSSVPHSPPYYDEHLVDLGNSQTPSDDRFGNSNTFDFPNTMASQTGRAYNKTDLNYSRWDIDWLDADDVEEYLRERGAIFAENGLCVEIPVQRYESSQTTGVDDFKSPLSSGYSNPEAQMRTQDSKTDLPLDAIGYNSVLPLYLGAYSRDGMEFSTADPNTNQGSNDLFHYSSTYEDLSYHFSLKIPGPGMSPISSTTPLRPSKSKVNSGTATAIVDVLVLIRELKSTVTCLGRTPRFRRKDIDAVIQRIGWKVC